MRVKSSSFTIFELLIVVVIIASVYTLFIQNIDNIDRKNPPLKLEALPKYLDEIEVYNIASIICLRDWDDRCQNCKLYIENVPQEIEFDFFDENKNPPISYRLNEEGRLQKIEFGKLVVDGNKFEEICFRIDKRYNNSTSESVLEYDNNIFIFYPYFHRKAQQVGSIGEANDILLKKRDKIKEVF